MSNTIPIVDFYTAHYEETLLRIEQNDNSLTTLFIDGGIHTRDGHGGRFNSRDGFARLGNSIGTNTHLTNLEVSMRHGIELDVTHREFFQGLMQNNSIKKVKLLCNGRYTLGRPVIHEILKAYWKIGNNNLVDLSIDSINLQNGGEDVLATTLQSCVNLTKLSITNSGISNDERLFTLVNAIRGNHSLEVLNLEVNTIGDAGCETLSTLITNPQSNIFCYSSH